MVVAPMVELGNENMNESMTLFVSLSLLHSTLGTVAILSEAQVSPSGARCSNLVVRRHCKFATKK